ncbi:MAG TPA: hypothetical protein VGT07_00320 [Steroidobacteraceae bacterium]|nr:hypothetical protein [Steroidobacteraceae bacterium]
MSIAAPLLPAVPIAPPLLEDDVPPETAAGVPATAAVEAAPASAPASACSRSVRVVDTGSVADCFAGEPLEPSASDFEVVWPADVPPAVASPGAVEPPEAAAAPV